MNSMKDNETTFQVRNLEQIIWPTVLLSGIFVQTHSKIHFTHCFICGGVIFSLLVEIRYLFVYFFKFHYKTIRNNRVTTTHLCKESLPE